MTGGDTIDNSNKLILFAGLFTASLVISNVIASKLFTVAGYTMTVALFSYPITFALTDAINEVWGKSTAQIVVLTGFLANILMVGYFWLGGILPAAPFWTHQEAYNVILGAVPRMVVASMLGYIVAQLHDVWAFDYWKRATKGKWLWLRNNLSTMVSQAIDSTIFLFVAFIGVMPLSEILTMLIAYYVSKIILAIMDTPIVYLLVGWARD